MQPPRRQARQRFAAAVSSILIFLLLLAACAPEDADFTPTAAPPTATLPPTATPEGAVEVVNEEEAQLAILKTLMAPISANGARWVIDSSQGNAGFDNPPNIGTGKGLRTFYTATSVNGQFEITYVIYPSAEEALTQYNFFKNEVRQQQLNNGVERDDLPKPNIVGGGADRGTIALMIAQERFVVEVFVKNFDSTLGDPRNAIARQAITALDEAVARFNTPDTKPQRIEAITAAIPEEVTLNGTVWTKFSDRPIRDDLPFGAGVQGVYRNEARDELIMNFLVFDLPQDAKNHFEIRRTSGNDLSLKLDFNRGGTSDQLDASNRMVVSSLTSGSIIVDLETGDFVEVTLTTSQNLEAEAILNAAAQQAVEIITSATGAGTDASDQTDDTATETEEPTATEEAPVEPTLEATTAIIG